MSLFFLFVIFNYVNNMYDISRMVVVTVLTHLFQHLHPLLVCRHGLGKDITKIFVFCVKVEWRLKNKKRKKRQKKIGQT